MKKIAGERVKWGIIGVGDVCEVKSAPAMQLIPNSEIVSVMRRDEEKVKDYARRHNISKWTTNAEELIEDPEINAIYIATPPSSHALYTTLAAQAQKPVYVEKPMATSFEECQAMVNVCKENDVPLYVAYYRRRLPNFEKIRSLIAQGEIGQVRLVNIHFLKSQDVDVLSNIVDQSDNWRVDPAISGGGYFYDLASHQLDFLDYLFGPIKSASGMASNQAAQYDAADIVVGNFEFESGIMGSGQWCFSSDKSSEKDEMTIIGSEGQVKISFFGEPKVYLKKSSASKVEVFQYELPHHIQEPLIETIVADLLGQGSCPSTGESAMRTNWVMHEMTKNYYRDNS